MSTDEAVTKDLLQTLEDGKAGYNKAAEELGELTETTLVTTFRGFAAQLEGFADELQGMAASYGDDPDRSGSLAATAHRGWMSVKEAVSSSDAKAILGVARQGEEHAVKEYEKALDSDISAGLRDVVQRQCDAIRAARDEVAALAQSR